MKWLTKQWLIENEHFFKGFTKAAVLHRYDNEATFSGSQQSYQSKTCKICGAIHLPEKKIKNAI